jgi:DNA-binding MarR family transcriptional regulator
MNEPEDSLNEREFELINIIGGELGVNQRDLSKQLAISLGMTNLLVRRLVAKGYIRIRQLNKKKSQYILTPKGFTEKYHKSVRYTLKTIHSIGLIRDQLNIIIQRLYNQGERVFFIFGNSDFAEVVEMSLNQLRWVGIKFSRVEQIPDDPQGIVLICREDEDSRKLSGERCVDLIKELASHKNNEFEGRISIKETKKTAHL